MDIKTRTCVGCNKKSSKMDFLRINFNTNDKDIEIDLYQNKNFRSYYVCKSKSCIIKSFKKKNFLDKFLKSINDSEFYKNLKGFENTDNSINKYVDKEFLYTYLKDKIRNELQCLIDYSFNKYSINDFDNIDNKIFRNCYLIMYSDDSDFSLIQEKPELIDIVNKKKAIKISNKFVSGSNKISIILDRKLANCIIENESLIVNFDGLL